MSAHVTLPCDDYAREKIAAAPNCAVAWWLMASFLYHRRSISLLTDEYFDELSEWLDRNWGDVEHQHKHLIDRDALSAGTGFYLKDSDYPAITRAGAETLVREAAGEIASGPASYYAREPMPDRAPRAKPDQLGFGF